MKYAIEKLREKLEEINTDSTSEQIIGIESLLRGINSHDVIPEHLHRELASVIYEIDKKSEYFKNSNVPYFVIRLINKLKGRKANAGEILENGQRKQNNDINDPNAAYKILRKTGIPLWPFKF